MINNNITLIAPSWAWKTTFWNMLWEKLWSNFIDFDDNILENITLVDAIEFCKEYNIKKESWIHPSILINTSVSELLELLWEDIFKNLEEFMTLKLKLEKNTIIATSWSQVYSEEAMNYLNNISTIIYLEVPLQEILTRFYTMKVDRIIWM